MCEHHHDHEHHAHEHGHHHDHSHIAETGVNRDRKILEYMIGHNAEHAQEMRDLAKRLQEKGKEEAPALILKAAEGFEAANGELQRALEYME